MKAIETIYNGYRFRSRLEARWAVFFTACGIKFTYEPEGFQFADGTRYLPDFYLPWFKCYVEIKPSSIYGEDLDEAEQKCRLLFEEGADCITMLCIGDPYDWNVKVFCNDATDSSGGSSEWNVEFLEGCQYGWEYDSKHTIRLCVKGNSRDRDFYTGDWNPAPLKDMRKITGFRSNFTHAKERARQARFEFGE